MWQPNGNQVLAQRAWVSGALYSEADFESTTVPIYAVGLNYEHNDFHRTTTGNDLKSNIVGIDGVFKFKGFSRRASTSGGSATPETGAKFDADGGYVQAGMMLNRRDVGSRVPLRRARRERHARQRRHRRRSRGALNYYYRRHTLKFQMDFGRVETGLGAAAATSGRTTSSGCRRSSFSSGRSFSNRTLVRHESDTGR